MERFSCKTEIISGAGAVSALETLGIRRLFLVTDPYFYENGLASSIAACAHAETTEIFHAVQPDPSVSLAAEGTAALKRFAPDTIVALGGGSAMDCAKAMAYFAEQPLRLIAIPTTSGSGSEVTDFSILTHDGIKHPLVDSRVRPDIAILDSELLQKLPRTLIADSGFDVLSHALEALVAKNAGVITDALAIDSFCRAYHLLSDSYRGDVAVRLSVHQAATMAGMAFTQAGLGICHALSHALGGTFHVPHGRLNAILLPAVLDANAPQAAQKYAVLAQRAGLGSSAHTIALRNLKNGLVRLRKELNLPASLAQAGIPLSQLRQQLPDIIHAAMEDPCSQTNPVLPTPGMLQQVVEAVMGHG